MKNIFKVLLISSVITYKALALDPLGNLSEVRATLANAQTAIDSAVLRTESLYKQNGGAALSAALDLLGTNPYLQNLSIKTDYKIKIQFAASQPTATSTSVTTPVTQALLGKKIILVPIHDTNDELITSWECVTNADHNVELFKGDDAKTALEGTASFITLYSDNRHLQTCIYISDTDMTALWT